MKTLTQKEREAVFNTIAGFFNTPKPVGLSPAQVHKDLSECVLNAIDRAEGYPAEALESAEEAIAKNIRKTCDELNKYCKEANLKNMQVMLKNIPGEIKVHITKSY